MVTRLAEKTFVGKNIIHVAVWNKNDDRTTYNLVYADGTAGGALAKRFNVTAITRDKEYDLTRGTPKSKLLYFSANLNGEAEVVKVVLHPSSNARNKIFDFDFSTLAIKGRSSQGNIVTKYPVKKITLESRGGSTLGAQILYFDEEAGRLNVDGNGKKIGEIDFESRLLAIYTNGTLEVLPVDLALKLNPRELSALELYDPEMIISAVYYDGNKGWTVVKRFKIEQDNLFNKFSFISDHPDSVLLFVTAHALPEVNYELKVRNNWVSSKVNLAEFIDIKGWKSLGNRLSSEKLRNFSLAHASAVSDKSGELHVGDTLEINIPPKQGDLFE